MADKVKTGEPIRAKQLNDVIDSVSIAAPSPNTPFRNTTHGSLVNGGSVYTTKAPSRYEPVFNITYGAGKLTDLFESETGYFNGIWVQLADWQSPDLYLYHSTFFTNPIYIFLIDPTSDQGKLVWLVGDLGKQGKWPLCSAQNSAGMAVFQLFQDEAGSSGTGVNGSCCLVIGDFTKFGA